MGRVAVAVALALALGAATVAVPASGASAPPSPWDGANPFACELQHAGYGTEVPHPDADPYCVEFAKRRQNVTELGVVDFLSKEPARVAAATDKCFYFQSDHWRGSIVQDDGSTKTYEWDGHYFFDRATGDGGAWVTNFNVNGRSGDPTEIPGFPAEYAPYFGQGTGGVRSHDEVKADPACAAKAAAHSPYAAPPPERRAPRCLDPSGSVGPHHVGPIALGAAEEGVWERLGPPVRVHRGFLRFCLRGGGKLLAGVPGDRSGIEGGPGPGATALLLTTRREMTARGIGRGDSDRALRRAFPHARRWFVQGHTSVLRLRSGVLAGVRHRRVRFLAAYDPGQVAGARAMRDWLRRSQ